MVFRENRMKIQPKTSIFILIMIALVLINGSEIRAKSGNDILGPEQGEANDYLYLPFVVDFPSVWFVKDAESPRYLQNYANNAGCNWLGIAGEVFDHQGDPVPFGDYQVHVWESGIDSRVMVGGAPAYGPSGYEQFLFDSPRIENHKLQLETQDGRPVSLIYHVQTRASCTQNLLYFVFIETN
jgi:hypothetical protein